MCHLICYSATFFFKLKVGSLLVTITWPDLHLTISQLDVNVTFGKWPDPPPTRGVKPERSADAAARWQTLWTAPSRESRFPVGTPRYRGAHRPLSMSTVNCGRRAAALAGRYWSEPASPPALISTTTPIITAPPRRMFRSPRRSVSSSAADKGSQPAAWARLQEDTANAPTAKERHVRSNRTLIYRDVKAFLNEVGGDTREARYWLTQFQRATSPQAPAFAVLEVITRSRALI